MKKSLTLSLAAVLTAASLYASEDGSGVYFGAAAGWSGFNAEFIDSDYYIDDDVTSGSRKTNSYDTNNEGYKIYGGYQFNSIIGVEGSFTHYGAQSSKYYSQKPESFAVSANAGYNFLNGQLRPFGLLGIGYLNTNQSRDVLDDDLFVGHFGLGIEYYPTVLRGFGLRAAFEGDVSITSQTAVDETGNYYSTETFWQSYSMFYFGAQYKF